ncbi:MAG: magnesium transporter CorA family protein [Chloroflexota bacterium]
MPSSGDATATARRRGRRRPAGHPLPTDLAKPAVRRDGAPAKLEPLAPGGELIVALRNGKTEHLKAADLKAALAEPATRLWIDMTEPPAARVAEVASLLSLHPLIAEDIAEHNQRAKIEELDDLVHIVLFALSYDGDVNSSEIDIVLTQQLLLTVHAVRFDPRTIQQLRMGVDQLLAHGPDRLLWAIADGIVDGYFPVFDGLADEIDELQDEVIGNATPETLQRLFGLKRELLLLRRATSPAREIFGQLTNRSLPAIRSDNIVYFRDVYDHLIRVTDELDNYRELVAGTLDVYLSTVNNNLAIIMKRLTGVTVILAGIGAVAGIFGMSEAGTAFRGGEAGGFWIVTLVVVALAAATAAILHRIDWI